MKVDVQAFLDAGDIFDIAAEEGRILHFNGAIATILMWKNRNTVLTIDFNGMNRPNIYVSLNEQYVKDNKASGPHYKERYKDWSYKEFLYNHFQTFPPEVVA